MKKNRILYPELLRILAAFFVVLIHVTSIGINGGPGTPAVRQVCVWFNSVSHWSVPVFFMISGMLFLDPEREVTPKKLFRKNIARLLRCMVIWGFFYSLLDQYQYGGLSLKSPVIAVLGILNGNTGYHLWYMYTQLALYLATPTLRVFTGNASKRQLEYALVIWFVMCILVGDVNRIAGTLLNMGELLPEEAVVIVDCAGYYLLGHYLHRYAFPNKWTLQLYVLTGLLLCAMPALNLLVHRAGTSIVFSDRLGIGCCISAVGIFVFASRLRLDLLSEHLRRRICWLSGRTFGIYLIHVFYVTLFFRLLKLDPFSTMPILGITISTVGIFLLSALTAELFSRLPLTKNLV